MITRRRQVFSFAKPAAAQLLDRRFVELRGRGQVVDARAVGIFLEVVEKAGQLVEVVRLADVAGLVEDSLGELGPQLRLEIVAGKLGDRLGQLGPPGVVRIRRPREADDPRVGRQAILAAELVKRGNQLAAGEVARGAEDDERVGHGELHGC